MDLNLFIISSDSIFLYLSSISSGEETTSEEMVELFRQVPGLVIWTAYMLVSNRVKATFVRRRKTEVATTMTPPPLPAEA
ncbi:MAG: DUF2569 family protein [Verrucomicrobia bacterium]|jgi:hypothetical protein|nr:DUF2569 family protein [Verrucomicrobiota bacterium]|tara:strand:+ start:4724 stop:4963 length:240 start_codon:yes stop_codon:yes gene_type:complete